MKLVLLPSSVSPAGDEQDQFLTTFLINDTVAIDAGSLGLYRSAEEQARVRHVFLSHSHIDHLGSLPVFLENVYQGSPACPTIYGSQAVIDCLRSDIFNGRIWPDFIELSSPEAPFLKLQTLTPGQSVQVAGLKITPVPVNHVVPTMGFVVEDAAAAVVIPSDTGPTQAIWDLANQAANLKAVFLEVTFPDALAELADIAKHLTPATFREEVGKLKKQVPVFALHIKPRFHAPIVAELQALGLPNLKIGRIGEAYTF